MDAGSVMDAEPGDAGTSERPEAPRSAYPVELSDEPTFEHPEPSGDYAVGTHVMHLVDEGRRERATTDPDDFRELMVQLFYPTDARQGPPAAITEDEVASVLTTRGLPDGWHLGIKTRSTFDVPIAATTAGWPVVIYSHGAGGFRFENQAVFEELASRGYVVAAISHPYKSGAVLLPDGRLARFVRSLLSSDPTPEEVEAAARTLAEILVDVWVPDILSVIAELERLDAGESWLSDRLDLERLGMFGWSLGGAAAYHACLADRRCDGAVDLDGTLLAWEPSSVLDKPFMFLTSWRHDFSWERASELHVGDAYTVRVAGTTHNDFQILGSYVSALFPTISLSAFGYGSIGPNRSLEIVRDYVVSFFERSVSGNDSPLLDGSSSEHPEVVLEHSIDGKTPGSQRALGRVSGRFTACSEDDVEPLQGVVVTGPADLTTMTDTEGAWQIGDLPDDSPLSFRLNHPEKFPALWTARRTGRFLSGGLLCVADAAELESIAEAAGTTLDPARGHIHVLVSDLVQSSRRGGVSLSTATGDTTLYLEHDLEVATSASSTVPGVGRAFVLNVEPGRVVLSFEPESMSCREANAANAAGAAEVLVEAGRLTMLKLFCE